MKLVVVTLALVVGIHSARAACPAPRGVALGAEDDEARIAWIHERLVHTSHRAKIWLRGWEIGIVAATAADLAMIPILGDTPSNRIDFGLGAATTIIGIVPLIFWEPRVIGDREALDARLAVANPDRCAVLADAERRLVEDASAQERQRSWYMHAGNVVLNAGVTLLFGAFHHWQAGVLNGIGGAIIGELIIFTEPTDQIDDLASYRRGELGRRDPQAWRLVPSLEQHGAGLSISFDL